MRINESVIVSVDIHSDDRAIMIVGSQKNNRMDIINAIQGDEVIELWNRLTKKKETKECEQLELRLALWLMVPEFDS